MIVFALLAELCVGDPPPATSGTADEAARYTAVGDGERAAGHQRTAAIAYRAALAQDQGAARARAALRDLCTADAAAPPADELTAGIARYRAGDAAGARPHLEVAARAGGALAAGAHFFLGMIALGDGDRDDAQRELALAEGDPAYVAPAREMRRLARRSGPLTLSLLVAPEWDSNVRRLPEAPPTEMTAAPVADADLLALASAAARPRRWLGFDATLFWRKHVQLDDMDLVGASAHGGVEVARFALRAGADVEALAGALYGTGEEVTAAYAGEALQARYTLRHRDYQDDLAAAFTGFVHEAVVGGRLRLGRIQLGADADGTRELTREPDFSAWSAGGTLLVRWAPLAGLRLAGGAGLHRAWYDGADTPRRDWRLAGNLDVELDLDDRLALVAGADVEREISNEADFTFTKVVIRAGIAGTLGLP